MQDCSEDDGTAIIITITDDDTGDPLEIPGAVVEVSPDPDDDDGAGSPEFTDNSDADNDDDPGVIELVDICGDDGVAPAATFDVSIDSLPGNADDCDVVTDEVLDTPFPEDGDDVDVELVIDCDDVNLATATPQATSTGTAGAARTVVVQSANSSLGCANTTIITITVRGANGQAVAAGTAVNIQASIGAVSPSSGQTTADGSVFVFYTAPQNQGGTATITATAGSASGTANITINCNTAPTQAPPPTTAPSGGIQPPNTGDGGLATGSSWQTYAGIAMIVASVIGTLAVVRPRA
ncbi:MAG TPA: hypothetical protein VG845_00500 [Dehalococcoidia bacterium]|nr:hypothetical protein [Dehalococcoidia bacterium]